MAVLDATFLIDAQRKPRRMAPLLERLVDLGEKLVVPAAAAIEFAEGIEDAEAAIASVESRFEIRYLDRDVVMAAVKLSRESSRRRRNPGAADVQIGATAVVERTFVATANPRHFRDALGVPVWDYHHEDEPPASD